MSFKEIEISVPWGIVAGKAFGEEHNKLIVAFHGYQDNANSFDNLIPLLPTSYYYISFDLPSHGKSSHLDIKGLPNVFDMVLAIKIILDNLNRERYIILAHSFGAQCGTFYAQMYPTRVEKLIVLDTAYFLPIDPEDLLGVLKRYFNLFSKLHILSEDTAPTYLLEDAVQRLQKSRVVPITDESATALLQRALKPVGDDKYKFRLAQHLKYLLRPPFDLSYQIKLVKANPIRCPHLLLQASKTKPYFDYTAKLLETFKKTNKLFVTHILDGTHDIHIENPELVAKYINNFLLNSKL